jgi:hypothetical protein
VLTGDGVLLARVHTVLTGFELANHGLK